MDEKNKKKELPKIINGKIVEPEDSKKHGFAPNERNPNNPCDTYSALSSNKTGEKIIEVYDFVSITDRDKKIIEEVISLLKKNDNSTVKEVTEKIKEKFEIAQIPMLKYEESLWYQFMQNENLGVSIQGYREVNIDGKKIRIPHIAFSADLDFLDDVLKRLMTKIRNTI